MPAATATPLQPWPAYCILLLFYLLTNPIISLSLSTSSPCTLSFSLLVVATSSHLLGLLPAFCKRIPHTISLLHVCNCVNLIAPSAPLYNPLQDHTHSFSLPPRSQPSSSTFYPQPVKISIYGPLLVYTVIPSS